MSFTAACGSSVTLLPKDKGEPPGQETIEPPPDGEDAPGDSGQDPFDSPTPDADATVASPCSEVQFVTNKDYLPIALALIKSAKTEIRASQLEFPFGVAPNQIDAALKQAASPPRNVPVKVLLDDQPEANPDRITSLANGNVAAKVDGCEKTLHTKLLVVDRNWVLVGSTNWSSSAMYYNNETNLCLGLSGIGEAFAQYEEGLWSSPCAARTVPKGPFGMVTLMADGQYPSLVKPLIDAARKRVHLVMYQLTLSDNSPSKDLTDAVIAARKRGLDVKAILELSSFSDSTNEINKKSGCTLKAGGVDVRLDTLATTTHAKLLVADDRMAVYSGNWGKSGLQGNHEAGAIVDSAGHANQAMAFFDKIWGVSTPIECP